MQINDAWLIHEPAMDALRALCESIPESVLSRPARKVDGSSKMTMRDGVALLPMQGMICPQSNALMDWLDEMIGVTTLDTFAADLSRALTDPNVSAIVLRINSPGGLTTDVKAVADMVYGARATKPVHAFVSGLGASAAYFIGSSATKMTLDPMAMVGSIGTVFSFSLPGEKSGQYSKSVDVVSDQSPMKRADPTTEAGHAEWKRLANELTDVFIETVARNRGVSRDTILADFGRGGMRVGADAVRMKMADSIGSLESLMSSLGRPQGAATHTNYTTRRQHMSEPNSPAPENVTPEATDVIALKAQVEALTSQLAEANSLAAKAKADAEAAAIEQKKAEANAKVDSWEREGRMTGNATAKVRGYYVKLATGEEVTAAEFEEVVAALPKIDASRVSENTQKGDETGITKEDFQKADRGDHAAKAAIDAHVKTLCAADPKKNYTAHYKAARAAAFKA